jgi:hypothetical protein
MLRGALAGIALIALAGCVSPTSYNDSVSASQIDSSTFRITALGNGATDPERVQDFAMFKAAQTTLAAGADYFSIISVLDRSESFVLHGAPIADSESTVIAGRVYTDTTITPGYSIPVLRPGQSLVIRVYKGQKPTGAAVFDAHEVTRFLVGRVLPPRS